MKNRDYYHWHVRFIFISLILMSVCVQFTLADIIVGNELSSDEKSVLFTKDGYYNFPPARPDEVRDSLAQWVLPETELRLSEEKRSMSTLSTGSVQLLSGWNYISFPKTISPYNGHNQAAYVFAGVDTGGYSILYYNSSVGYWAPLTATTVIKPLVGYVVYSVGSCSLDPDYLPPGQQPNPSINVSTGWNLIGYFDPMGNYADDYLHAAMARDEMAPIGSDWAKIIGWNAATQQYETTIIKNGDDIYSDYRLVYPAKGYWLWMMANRSLTYPVSHTYTCSAEWVSEYPGDDLDLPASEADAEGFYDILRWAPYWSGAFIRGDNVTPPARAADWKDPSYYGGQDDNPNSGIDSTNFAFFSGHGWERAGILFAYGYPDREEQNLWYNETIWGNTKVDWVALDACHVLNQSNNNYAVWQNSFKGLHSIVGWDTFGISDDDMGVTFADKMTSENPKTIWESWKLAGDFVIHYPGFNVGILAVDIDGDLNTEECIADHIYGQGTWFSPAGYDLHFDKDFHPCDPN